MNETQLREERKSSGCLGVLFDVPGRIRPLGQDRADHARCDDNDNYRDREFN